MDVLSLGITNNETFDYNTADLLKCGMCATEFLLSDILVFIQHKTRKCRMDRPNLEDKENYLKCSNCPESFGSASSLLEHAQFTHKIAIFLETNHSDSQKSTPCPSPTNLSTQSSCSSAAVANMPTKFEPNYFDSKHGKPKYEAAVSKSTGGMSQSSMKSNNSRNEIYIDVIPGVSSSSSSHKGQQGGMSNEYNITVSSSPMASSSSPPSTQSGTSMIGSSYFSSSKSRGECKSSPALSSSSSSMRPRGLVVVDHNENTCSSTDSGSSANRFDDQHSGKESTKADANEFKPLAMNSNSNGSDEKPSKKQKPTAVFYCNVCHAAFNQKIHLTKHSAKHTGIKPFKCTECNYSTVERSHLKVHVRVHTGEKPFKCTFCEYATAQSSTLKIHKKRHHDKHEQSSPSVKSLEPIENSHQSQDALTMRVDEQSKEQVQKIINSDSVAPATTPNEQKSSSFDIYRDKKNLPPTKRFKNYSFVESTSASGDHPRAGPSPDEDDRLVIDVDKDCDGEMPRLKTVDNKLLDLAKIALERETS